jgi:endonuclease YncB( thermonuclease family)
MCGYALAYRNTCSVPRKPPILIGLVLIAAIAALGASIEEWLERPARPPAATGAAIAGRARVVDGDSLEVAGRRIRLFGIDAPEVHQDCRDGHGIPYACGARSRAALAQAIANADVSCTPVGESYDRDVALCTANGRDLSEAMVRGGHALELRRHSQGRYAAAEREAREARRGLWAGSFERPSDWRHSHPR